ncbi:hypothetical protein ACUNWD_20500 [Sunxiuqinia sp. A32]|uniref:hypothetical protein n=1 Tax=Sunxiuqinia sp. A32 TaxID=3461496 RepID=UPI004046507C
MQRIFLIAILIFMLAGCYFSPSGEHFEELDQVGKLPYVDVELNFDTDTLYVYNNEWIHFHYTKNGDLVNWARFIIDGEAISPNPEEQGAVELSWYFPGFPPGTHSLSLQLYTRSRTGSIADLTGAEGFLLQQDWVLKVVDDWEMGPAIIATSFESGMLKIQWEEFKGLNFENYQVYKYVQPTGLPDQLVATITDQHQTTVTDPNYHGENSRYYVLVNDRHRGRSLDIEGPIPQVSATNNAQGNIVLHWEKPPFWAALKGYRIMDDDISWTNEGFVPLYLVDGPSMDSIEITDPYFAYNYNLWLQLDPSGTIYLEDWSRPVHLATKVTASSGQPSPEFINGRVGIENRIYLSNYKEVDVFNTELNQVVETIQLPVFGNFEVSAGNKFLIANMNEPNQLYFLDLENPDNHKIIDFSGQLPYIEHITTVADNGTGIVLSGQNIMLYDFVNEKIIADGTLVYKGLYQHYISGDGKYFCVKNWGGFEFLQLMDNELVPMEELNMNGNSTVFADFLTGEQPKLVRVDSEKIEVIDCTTQTILHQWDLTHGVNTEVFHVDKAGNQLFLREGENLVLLNTETGMRIILGKTYESHYLNWWGMKYNNGQILWDGGRRLDVESKL